MKAFFKCFAGLLPSLVFSTTVSAYTLSEQCFQKSTIESLDSVPAHDPSAKSGENLYVGLDLESRGSKGAIVYVKIKPQSVYESIVVVAASRGSMITACFEQSVAAVLKRALSSNKKAPRYEHQSVVEFLDVMIPSLGMDKMTHK